MVFEVLPFSLKMHYKTKILIAAVIKSFMFIRPEPLKGKERTLSSCCPLLFKVARLLSCPVERVDEAKDLCP